MSPEEKAVRMMLLDKSPDDQEYYRVNMEHTLEDFKYKYSLLDENDSELWLCSLSIAMLKFAEYVEESK